jgi:hypothetical protein
MKCGQGVVVEALRSRANVFEGMDEEMFLFRFSWKSILKLKKNII